LRFAYWVWHTHFVFVQLATLAQAANLVLFQLTQAPLAPALPDPAQDRKDEFHHTALVPQLGTDLGPSALLCKGARGKVGGAHVVLRALGDVEMIETGLGSVQ
jgi:hypothetical protein